MKIHPYQLCRWCDAALHQHRKWIWLISNALLLLLSAIFGLMWLVLPILLLANATTALYLLHRHHAFGEIYQRTPRPQDALCETVLIDAALIGQGTRLRGAAQPIDVADELSLRLGSGVLLLGAAMVLTADELPSADRSAILSAVQALNLKPDRLRSHNPLLRQECRDQLTIVTVRDGISERQYYLGAPAAVSACCTAIWEGQPRPMTEHDLLRIEDTARYITQADCRVLAWATALNNDTPVFLGMAGLGERIVPSVQGETAALRAMGLTVMLDAGNQPDADLAGLRSLLELPDHHARADIHLTAGQPGGTTSLCITRLPGDSLVEPVQQLRLRFRTIEDTLRRFLVLLALPLAVALLSGSSFTPLFLTGMLLYAAIAIGVDLTASCVRWPIPVMVCGLAIISRLFLSAQPPQTAAMASGLIAVVAGTCSVLRLCGKGFTLKGEGRGPSLVLTGVALLLLIGLVLYGMLQGIVSLIPLLFSLIIGVATILLMGWEN